MLRKRTGQSQKAARKAVFPVVKKAAGNLFIGIKSGIGGWT